MLISELADELHVRPSVVTKMRKLYAEEAGLGGSPPLAGDVLKHLRDAHQLKMSSKGMTTRQAIRQVLGEPTVGLSADDLSRVERRLDRLEATLAQMNDLLRETHEGVDLIVSRVKKNQGTPPSAES